MWRRKGGGRITKAGRQDERGTEPAGDGSPLRDPSTAYVCRAKS
jgi:hypothetical protein